MFADFRKAWLVWSYANFAVVGLSVDEVNEELVKLHGWEVPCEYVQVALKWKAYAKCVLIGKDLGKDVIKYCISR